MVTSEESSVVYVGNNSTTAPYPINFYFFHDEDLLVTTVDTLGTEAILELNTEYIVTGAGNQNGGSLTTTFAVPIDWHLRIERIVEPTQLTSYQEGDAFPALSHERALDKLTFLVQQALRTGSSGSGGGGGRAWADDAERQLTTPSFIGQLGFQVNTATIYYSTSTATGAWKKAIFDNLGATAGQAPVFSSDAHLTNIVIDGVATLTGGVLGATAKPAGDLVGTTQVQTLTNKTLESPVLNTPTGLTKASVGLGNVDNTSDINKPISNSTQVSLDQKEDKANKGQNGGYAGLDATGKVPLQQMPQSVLGANVYQGTWNAATNTPTIPAAALGNQGWYWVVSVAGSTNIDGISTWAPGDWIISNGTAWERIINIDSVSSVNAKTGAVVINKADVGLSNVDNTSDATKNAAVTTLTNKTLTAPVINSPTGLVKADVGLGNVDNTSDATKNAASATLTNKTIDGANNTLRVWLDTTDVVNNLPVSHLNSGSGASATTFWRGDGQWITPPGSGDVTGPAGAVPGELATYANSTGKLLGRTTLPQPPEVIGDTVQGTNPNAIAIPSFVNHPDRIFVSPSAFDDHFEGTSLDAKWTRFVTAGLNSEISQVANSKVSSGGWSPSTADGINYYNYITQSLPNTNDFSITLGVDTVLLNRDGTAGSLARTEFQLINTTNNLGAGFRFFSNYVATPTVGIYSMRAYGGAAINTQLYHFYAGSFPKYIKLTYTASTRQVGLYYSNDGNAFMLYFAITSAQSGFTASVLPQVFRILTAFANSGQGVAHVDWVKFTNP
jgi:hypothetical protein